MWKWIHRGLHRPRREESVMLGVEQLTSLLTQLEAESPRLVDELFREKAEGLLSAIHRKCRQVEADAGDYPRSGIRGDVWIDGASLAPVAEHLADLLRARGEADLERWAHILRCRAVLAVQSHYHHVVGPAMLARADCEERLGNHEEAVGLYDAIVADFAFLVDHIHGEAPSDEDQLSLESLCQAILRRRRLGEKADLAELERRAQDTLHRKAGAVAG